MGKNILRRYLKKRGDDYFYDGSLPDPENHNRLTYGEFILTNPVEVGRVPHYQEGDKFQRRFERPPVDLQREINAFGKDVFIHCKGRDYIIMKGVPICSYNPSRPRPRDMTLTASAENKKC